MTYSCDTRNLVVRLYMQKGVGSFHKVAALTDIAKSTVQRWVAAHPFCRRSQQHSNPRRSLFQHATHHIQTFLSQNPQVTAALVKKHLLSQHGICTSTSTVARTIKRMGWTCKLPSISTADAADPSIAARREAFKRLAAHINPTDVISVDESSFYLKMCPSKGYAPKGKRFHLSRDIRLRRIRMTLLMAISTTGVVGWELFEGNCNAQRFALFLQQTDFEGRRYVLLDNVRFHHSCVVKQAFEAKDVSALYLPPYTPQWQPIEYAFHSIKHQYRQTHPSDGTFWERVSACISLVNNQSLAPFAATFNHCWMLARSGQLWAP
jgi:transposase